MLKPFLAVLLLAGCSSHRTSTSSSSSSSSSSGTGGRGGSPAWGGGTPFRYVFVRVKENHTFDNLFGAFPGANGATSATLSNGSIVPLTPITAGPLPANPNHGHQAAVIAWAKGAMNGFDLVPQLPQTPAWLPLSYYTEADIPNYYAYAKAYALCDNLFTLTLADSFAGYMGLIGATSIAIANPSCGTCNWGCDAPAGTTVQVYDPATCGTTTTAPCFDIPSIVDQLPAGATWRAYSDVYGGQLSSSFAAFKTLYQNGSLPDHTRNNSQLLSDLQAGDIANLTFVWDGPESEHPPDDICPGENETVQIANALMQSPIWNQTLLIVTYDDWGGFYDHVPPPGAACNASERFTPGFRVPALLISPYSRPGPFHELATQASIDRLIEQIFDMPAMAVTNPRAQDAGPAVLLDAFDFSHPPVPGMQLAPRACP